MLPRLRFQSLKVSFKQKISIFKIKNNFLFLFSLDMFGSELSSENKKSVQTLVDVVTKFTQARVDPMEFFLLKSIIMFKSGNYFEKLEFFIL